MILWRQGKKRAVQPDERPAGQTHSRHGSVLPYPAHRSGPGFVLSFFLIENLLWKLQLCPLMSQEMVNVHFSKIRKAAKKEGQEEKGKIFGMMCFFVLLCPECGRAARQPPPPLGIHCSLPQTIRVPARPARPTGGHGSRTGTCSQDVTSVPPPSSGQQRLSSGDLHGQEGNLPLPVVGRCEAGGRIQRHVFRAQPSTA